MTDPFGPQSFTWIAGIEDTCVYPPADFGMLPLNEFDLTDHTLNWRADLEAVRELGGTALRYGVNWPLVHTAPGEFDWSMLDERLAFATGELGLTVIADLVHYGTPTWLAAILRRSRLSGCGRRLRGSLRGTLSRHGRPRHAPQRAADDGVVLRSSRVSGRRLSTGGPDGRRCSWG